MQFFQAFKKQTSFFVAVPTLVWQILFLYIPLFFLLSAGFFKQWQKFSASDLTLQNFRAVCTVAHGKIIGWSFAQALLVALLCLIIGYPVAYFFAVKMRRWKDFFLFFLMLPFWTNFLVQAYAWFFVLDRHGLLNNVLLKIGVIHEPLQILYTPFAVTLVMFYCYLPFMILPLYGVLEKFDLRLVEASLDLGASSLKTFLKITLPLTMPGVRNGFLLVLVTSFGEYAIPAIMGGGRYFYVGSLISSYFLEAHDPAVGASFTAVSSLVIFVAVFIASRILRGSRYVTKEH